jgi:hypothetical protein
MTILSAMDNQVGVGSHDRVDPELAQLCGLLIGQRGSKWRDAHVAARSCDGHRDRVHRALHDDGDGSGCQGLLDGAE